MLWLLFYICLSTSRPNTRQQRVQLHMLRHFGKYLLMGFCCRGCQEC